MPTPKKIEFQFLFHTPFAANQVDRANGVIRGVSLITAGVKARGHELHTDDITLQQMEACAQAVGKIPVKLNHQSGIEKVCGYVTNVRREGVKLLGDWYLLKSHIEFEAMMERAERMPESFGLSAAFMGESELMDGRPTARCTELLAVDCVAQPAANPSGLFSRRVDTRQTGMDSDPNNQNVPAEMPAWFKPFADKLDSIASQQEEISQYHAQLQQQAIAQQLLAMSPEERAALTPEELQQYGITREEVAEIDAIAARMSEADANGDANANGNTGTEGATGANANGNAAGAGAAGAGAGRSGTVPAGSGMGNTAPAVAALQAEIHKLRQFQARLERKELTELQAREAAERDQAITTLEEKTNALLVELRAKDDVIARYEQAGVRIPASKEGVNLFSAKEGDGRSHQFQILVANRLNELKAENPKAGPAQLKLLEARAVRETIRDHKKAFEDYRSGSITLERR